MIAHKTKVVRLCADRRNTHTHTLIAKIDSFMKLAVKS